MHCSSTRKDRLINEWTHNLGQAGKTIQWTISCIFLFFANGHFIKIVFRNNLIGKNKHQLNIHRFYICSHSGRTYGKHELCSPFQQTKQTCLIETV
jgi:hypothetical protein